jgi:hypothetical protein
MGGTAFPGYLGGLTRRSRRWWSDPVNITIAGRNVLEDRANRIRLHGIDVWRVGAPLHAVAGESDRVLRWARERRGLVPAR